MEERTYTMDEVNAIVYTTFVQSIKGYMEWQEKETHILNKDTKEHVPNCMTEVKPNAKKPHEYIFPRLKEHGIMMTVTEGFENPLYKLQ
jgi:hypothetical protein